MLLIVTFGWGVSYFMMDLCLDEMQPLNLNAVRFIGAFTVAWTLTAKKVIHVNKTTLKYAFYVSVSLVFVYIGATYGVKYTTQSNAGFLCATSSIFTPILAYLIKKNCSKQKTYICYSSMHNRYGTFDIEF